MPKRDIANSIADLARSSERRTAADQLTGTSLGAVKITPPFSFLSAVENYRVGKRKGGGERWAGGEGAKAQGGRKRGDITLRDSTLLSTRECLDFSNDEGVEGVPLPVSLSATASPPPAYSLRAHNSEDEIDVERRIERLNPRERVILPPPLPPSPPARRYDSAWRHFCVTSSPYRSVSEFEMSRILLRARARAVSPNTMSLASHGELFCQNGERRHVLISLSRTPFGVVTHDFSRMNSSPRPAAVYRNSVSFVHLFVATDESRR